MTIVGAGALGMLLAAKLAAAGAAVELAVRSEAQKQAVAQQGVLLTDAATGASDVRHMPVRLLSEPSALAGEPPDAPHWILLAMKQTAVDAHLAQAVRARMDAASHVVCFQNGIGHMEALAAAIPPERLLVAVTTEAAWKRSLRACDHTGRGTTWIGPVSTELGAAAAEGLQKKLVHLLETAGFHSFVSNDITSRVWQKLLINAVINPLTALLQVPNGALLSLSGIELQMRELLDEGLAVAQAKGIPLAPDLWEQLLQVCRTTAANRSSMLQDVLAGRTTEIDAITGGLLREAERAGLELPASRTVYRLIKGLEARLEISG